MIPPLFRGLCDDAAMFPPGNASAPDAVAGHEEYRDAWYRELVGPLIIAGGRIGEVVAAADGRRPRVVVVGTGLPAEPPPLDVVGVELAAEDVAAAVALLDRDLPPGATGTVEVPRGPGTEKALDLLAATPYRAKFRTGGTVAEAFPGERELAESLVAAVARGLPFKCTAGLHNAVRHADPATGFEHHGFLNVLAATHAARDGGDADAVAGILALRSGPSLAELLTGLDARQAEAVRGSFVSYGTCSITEPLDDLIALGLIPAP
ncbi:hypothetical protein [Actinocorallia longicatena]|uniref:Uncharacterized protein n=1 Tax=Actinocorallia longicatena TaxID=111803 RepID=A0ABP6Q270_9ACTN